MLALGAWRLARGGVLTRQPQAIEALGTTTRAVRRQDRHADLQPHGGGRAGDAGRAGRPGGRRPAPRALRAAARTRGAGQRRRRPRTDGPGAAAVARAPFGPAAFDGSCCGARAWRRTAVRAPVVAHHRWRAAAAGGEGRARGGARAVRAMRRSPRACAPRPSGWRGRACACSASRAPIGSGARAPEPLRLAWCGLLGFHDPLRDDVPAAIAQCRRAGMRVVMITGDAPATARRSRAQAGHRRRRRRHRRADRGDVRRRARAAVGASASSRASRRRRSCASCRRCSSAARWWR